MGTWLLARRSIVVSLVLACGSAGTAATAAMAPSGPGAKVTKEQLEYSKQMYAEGEAAMKAGDHATALAKYHEGYRYAPHLHVFTYSIGAAAEATGDCRTAFTYYRMFLDLVPEHPERKAVQTKYDQLGKTCRFDEESESVNSATEQAERARDRGKREAEESVREAVTELRIAQRVYAGLGAAMPDSPFSHAAKRKAKDDKRMTKLATRLGISLDGGAKAKLEQPASSKEACRDAVRQEHRIIEALELVLEHHEDRRSQKIAGKALRTAERDEATFEECR